MALSFVAIVDARSYTLYAEVSLGAEYMIHKVVEQGVFVLARPGALALSVKLSQCAYHLDDLRGIVIAASYCKAL